MWRLHSGALRVVYENVKCGHCLAAPPAVSRFCMCVPRCGRTVVTHYETLDVPRTATPDQIKAAFVKQSKQVHPDTNPDDPSKHDKFITLNTAYTTLIRAQSRREYDLSLAMVYQRHQHMTRHGYTAHASGASAKPGSSSTGQYDGEGQREFWDETIWSMRDRSKDPKMWSEQNYYGIRGMQKVADYVIVLGCMIFIGVGATVHFCVLKYSSRLSQQIMDRKDRVNVGYLNESRSLARQNGNARQLELLNLRVLSKKNDQSSAATSGAPDG